MIELVPFGRVDISLVHGLAASLGKVFRAGVCISSPVQCIDRFYDEGRSQYCSPMILQYLASNGERHWGGSRTLAIIGEDLYTPILTYVFGEAEFKGKAAIVSTYRLRPEVYGLAPDRLLVSYRLLKEAVHELGHTFGLVHCMKLECVMHASTYVEDLDLKSDKFCTDCTRVVQHD